MLKKRLQIVLLASLSGCTSISSTMLNRTDNDVFVGNSNGEPDVHCGARPFKGVPITLRVPTHLDVSIMEKIYLRKLTDGKLVRVQTTHRNLTVEPKIIETDKVFTVDPKRPAAGTLASTLTWGTDSGGKDNSQYFASIVNNIKDETIVDVTAALSTLLPTLKGLSTDAAANAAALARLKSLNNTLIVESRTVAWKRFDLDEPGFEHLVADFVSQHMNCCNTCEIYGNSNSSFTPNPPTPSNNDASMQSDAAALPIINGTQSELPFTEPAQSFLELSPAAIR